MLITFKSSVCITVVLNWLVHPLKHYLQNTGLQEGVQYIAITINKGRQVDQKTLTSVPLEKL